MKDPSDMDATADGFPRFLNPPFRVEELFCFGFDRAQAFDVFRIRWVEAIVV